MSIESMMTTTENLYKQIVEKSIESVEFRAELVADPKAVISREFGVDVPEGMNVHVHEGDMQNAHLALPPLPDLDEEQLESVSGSYFSGCS